MPGKDAYATSKQCILAAARLTPDLHRTHRRPPVQEYRLRLNGHRLCYIVPLFKVTYKLTKSSPHQRTHAAEKDTKLVDRNGRKGQPCGHFAQATGTVSSLTPKSPALHQSQVWEFSKVL